MSIICVRSILNTARCYKTNNNENNNRNKQSPSSSNKQQIHDPHQQQQQEISSTSSFQVVKIEPTTGPTAPLEALVFVIPPPF